ncbi:hypothetical protein GOD44_12470 [Sinorhizobium medicae]|nr:hypothetical protein [Sinorhizobium medicae]MDX0775281.1 hypothetical protein [Sinorhizobium medicae]MDX1059847.1 hypothetical protein [Sinorhizobium medicae]
MLLQLQFRGLKPEDNLAHYADVETSIAQLEGGCDDAELDRLLVVEDDLNERILSFRWQTLDDVRMKAAHIDSVYADRLSGETRAEGHAKPDLIEFTPGWKQGRQGAASVQAQYQSIWQVSCLEMQVFPQGLPFLHVLQPPSASSTMAMTTNVWTRRPFT